MKKFSLFKILGVLGMFGLNIDGGDGGGSSDVPPAGTPPQDDSSHRDVDIKDEDLKENSDDKLKDLESRVKSLDEIVSKKQKEEAVNTAVASIKTDYPTFDESKIIDKLKEIQKTDPAKAAALNNPAGWELLHLKHFESRKVDNDEFDSSRSSRNEPFDHDEALGKAKTGDTKALSALYENSISTSSKRN